MTTFNEAIVLHLAFTALGIKEGDKVIILIITFSLTADAIIYTEAKTILIDVKEDS